MHELERLVKAWAATVAACAVVWAGATWWARRLDAKSGSTVL
ncbi:hypothetical protein SEA_BOGOTA_49 [Streptomyces phage Bogota]|nr:hypothetical protein SEA_UNTPL_50 [Streptomyces phage UNTPL]WIC89199.1 hypothetical protein SEA_BOGOTA_49 [Streptomyces phage Bogota]